jgi:hypothetical protein
MTVGNPPVVCVNGQWVGEMVGCAIVDGPLRTDVPACVAEEYASHGGCAAAYNETTCVPSSCNIGYTGTPTGTKVCVNGRWEGTVSGCTLVPVPVPVPVPVEEAAPMPGEVPRCNDPLQIGYTYTCSGEHASECRPVGCAAGFMTAGPVRGKLVCLNAQWRGTNFSGCEVSAPTPAACTSGLSPAAWIRDDSRVRGRERGERDDV